MCQGCVNAVQEVWGDLSDEARAYLLWNATPFPVGGPESVRAALIKAHKESGGDVGLAVYMAEKQMETAGKAAEDPNVHSD